MLKGFLRVAWIPWCCFDLYYLTYVPRQKGEAIGAHLTKPRSIAPTVLPLSAMLGSDTTFTFLYAK